MIEVYRLFRISDQPTTLFHGIDGSKKLSTDVWINADIKEVRNPGKKEGPTFTSGFHVCQSKEETIEYLKRFKNPDELVVCRVYVSNLRPKPRSTSNIQLADRMLIKKEDWDSALENING